MMDGGMGAMTAWMLLWGLVAIAFIGFAVVGIVTMVQRSARDRGQVSVAGSPDDVLKRRYAAGEIDEDEYVRRRAGLTG